ncbi:MAG: RNA polymerase sigma factor [Betaproteobacteria bacterium]|nr:RNA polymerase sigma factor [Betaproteobacteria bacterium]
MPAVTPSSARLKRVNHAPIADEDLVLRYAGGDAAAFEHLYSRHRGGLYRFITRQCGDRGAAEELFQDVWSRVIETRARYRVEARFATWLYTLAHHRLIDWYRKSSRVVWVDFGREEEGIDTENAVEFAAGRSAQPEVRAESREIAMKLLVLLEQLPPQQREVFLLHEEGGLSIEEIAAATVTPTETAKSRLRYALAKLRRGLQDLT